LATRRRRRRKKKKEEKENEVSEMQCKKMYEAQSKSWNKTCNS